MTNLTEGSNNRTDEQKLAPLNSYEEARARLAALPPVERHFRNEIATRDRKHNWSAEVGGLIGRAWIGRFRVCDDSPYRFKSREIFFVVERNGLRVAAGTLKIWRGFYDEDGGGWDLHDFVHHCDMNSQSEYDTATTVARVWGGDNENRWWTDDPFCYGDLCSFDRLVIDAKTTAEVEASWQIVNALIKRIRRGVAVMVLKAFPLDYEGNETTENRATFERRRRALVRLYQRRIGFERVPHEVLADEGWMLRLFNDGARPDIEGG
ncbi:hypothetical protein V1291_005557 [Nitrobacteraceae bacterium AZCC 1564]